MYTIFCYFVYIEERKCNFFYSPTYNCLCKNVKKNETDKYVTWLHMSMYGSPYIPPFKG